MFDTFTLQISGIVGDWKVQLSEAQSKALDELCEEKLAGTRLSFN